jgi:hypothetical protein
MGSAAKQLPQTVRAEGKTAASTVNSSKGEYQMRRKSVWVIMVVAATLLPQSLVFGQRRGFGGWGGGGLLGGPMTAAYLGLSSSQMSSIKSMQQAEWATLKPLMQQLRTYQQQLQPLAESANYNAGQVATLAQEIAGVQAQITEARLALENQIYTKVLNSSQQAELIQLQQQMQQMHQNHQSSSSSSSSSSQ